MISDSIRAFALVLTLQYVGGSMSYFSNTLTNAISSVRSQLSVGHTANAGTAVRIVLVLLVVASCLMHVGTAAASEPMGWAVVPANGVEGTIGGGNGNVVTATTLSQLSSYAGSSDPLVILVSGTITGSGTVSVNSNKTILGQGSGTTLSGVGLDINTKSNIIIRNLKITGAVDAIATRYSHHIWIDHCDVYACGDGLIDITRATDYITVSWTRFSNHDKCMLINSGTDHPEDVGKLNTTLHHNWYNGTNQRNPRVGYGKVHVFNNLCNNNGSYCIGVHSDCRVLAERNYFINTNDPILQCYVTDPLSPYWGHCQSVGNVFINCTGKIQPDGISFSVNDYYLYDFTLDTASSVQSVVQASVGPAAAYGEISLMPIPGNGAVKISTTPTLKWTKGPSATSYIVYFGTSPTPPQVYTTSGQTYNPGTLGTGYVYYWRVDQVTGSGTVTGRLWRFVVGEYGAIPDETPPTPDPMTWATAPYGASETSIAMVAATATDDSGVEYFFDCTSGGGHDSGWQDSATYTDTGLTLGVTYSYQVKARDKSPNHNETGWSGVASASPIVDTTAPAPDPMTWASAPVATGIDTITMTATTATDVSGVEYFFANITDPNHDSGWQDSTSYTDTGLVNNMTYTYRVIARDKSSNHNETGWSDEAEATTIRYECTAPVENDFNGDCRADFMDYATFASDWGAESGTAVNLVTNGDFTTSISSWTLADVSGASGTMTAAFDGTAGNPAGSALMSVEAAVQTNNHRFYQCVPVTVGHQYVLAGEWSGDIRGLVTDGSGGTLRNWAELYVGFETSTTPTAWTSMAIMYKKAYGAGLQNTTTGVWGWEPITDSPNGTTPPAGGIFTATAPYMVIAFNLGGRAGSGNTYINADNISVVETGGTPCPEMDLNGDCALDWLDVKDFAESWLNCNRNPAEECSW